MQLPMGMKEIWEILPHRPPFLLVDRIVELEPNKRVVGLKSVTINEPFFAGHFPGNPIMPGVLIIEAMAQVGGVLGAVTMGEEMYGQEMFFMGMDKVRFRKVVVPGDQLLFELTMLRGGPKHKAWKLGGKAFVGKELVAEAELTALIGGSK